MLTTSARPLAVVTGAGSGIGAAIARRLADHHDLLLHHRDDSTDGDPVVQDCRRRGAEVRLLAGDLATPTGRTALVDQVRRAGSAVRTVVSCAGAYPRIPWSQTTPALLRVQVELNLLAHMDLALAATPALITAGPAGRFIAVSSVLATLGRVDLAGYIAAKAGLEGFVRALARELGPAGVTVNTVQAGSIEVPAEHDVVDDHDAMVGRQLDRQCLRRRGTPADIAGVVAFLASADAGFVTGQTVTVDGGWCLH